MFKCIASEVMYHSVRAKLTNSTLEDILKHNKA